MVRGWLPGSSAMAPGQGLVAGDGGAFGQVAAHEAVGVLVRAPFPRAVGVGEEHVDPGGGGQALVAGHFAPLVPGQGAHRAVGQCADAAGEGARTRPRPPGHWGRPTRTRQPVVRSTRVAQALAPLLADDQAASSQFPGTTRSSIVRAPARSTACPRSGAHNPPDGCPLLRTPPPGGSTILCSYEAPPPMACGSTCGSPRG